MSIRRIPRKSALTNRSGVATVEFAIVAVPLFLFIFACVEFCRVLMCIHVLEEGARAGCRSAVLEVASDENLRDDIDVVLAASAITKYTVKTVPEDITSVKRFKPVTVSVNTNFGNVSLLPLPKFVSDFTISAACTLPAEHGSD